jgi:polyisoprenoid-binding protein YceI
MKTKFLKSGILLIVCSLFLIPVQTNAQELTVNPKTFSMTIYGTTNVHNFDMKATQASGSLVMVNAKQAKSLEIEIPVKGLKSNEKLMDTKTYEAFNAEKNPKITFKSTDVNSLSVNGSDINVSISGNMTIAGVTKKVTLVSVGKVVKPGVYEFKGSIALKMTDYKMSPPTAMLGMMKVGDAITLKYDVTFEGAPVN